MMKKPKILRANKNEFIVPPTMRVEYIGPDFPETRNQRKKKLRRRRQNQ